VFKNEGRIRDAFVLASGHAMLVSHLSRKVNIQVLSIAPRDHVHEAEPVYDEASVREMLDGVALPPPAPAASAGCPTYA
jgi:hypothetical protein